MSEEIPTGEKKILSLFKQQEGLEITPSSRLPDSSGEAASEARDEDERYSKIAEAVQCSISEPQARMILETCSPNDLDSTIRLPSRDMTKAKNLIASELNACTPEDVRKNPGRYITLLYWVISLITLKNSDTDGD